MHHSMKKWKWIFIATTMLVLAFALSAGAATINIKASHGSPLGSAPDEGWQKFKALVEERSGGAIAVQIFPNNQLGSDRETSESVQLGNLHMSCPSSSILAPFAKDLFVLDMFFLFKDREAAYRVLDGEPGKTLLSSLEKSRFKGLGFMENGFRNLSNNKRPVRTPADTAGLKIRVMENPLHIAAWKALGANPTPMAFTELFTAMQQGTVDGQENPLELIHVNRFYEIQKYITMTGHVYTPYVVIVNKPFFDGLSPEHQKLIQEAMDEAIAWQRQKARELDNVAREAIQAAGTQIIDLTDDEHAQFREKLMPIRDLVREKAGKDIVDLFLKATEE